MARVRAAFVFDFAAFVVYFLFVILILSGPVHSGKTSLLRKLAGEWKEGGIPFDGYLSPAVVVDDRTIGYDWLDLKTGRSLPFLRMAGQADWQKIGSFFLVTKPLGGGKRKKKG
ncbi:MAG: nucleoside-triphosphatase, partial [Acidobacteriota bacterium]